MLSLFIGFLRIPDLQKTTKLNYMERPQIGRYLEKVESESHGFTTVYSDTRVAWVSDMPYIPIPVAKTAIQPGGQFVLRSVGDDENSARMLLTLLSALAHKIPGDDIHVTDQHLDEIWHLNTTAGGPDIGTEYRKMDYAYTAGKKVRSLIDHIARQHPLERSNPVFQRLAASSDLVQSVFYKALSIPIFHVGSF